MKEVILGALVSVALVFGGIAIAEQRIAQYEQNQQ